MFYHKFWPEVISRTIKNPWKIVEITLSGYFCAGKVKSYMREFKIGEVFLVDDDSIVRIVTSKILKNVGFKNTISQFENGESALFEIRKRINNQSFVGIVEPILLLLDINMPVLDAWGFLEEFTMLDEENKNHFKITIITSSIDTNDRLKAFSYPQVLDYITKPISSQHVTDFLSQHKLLVE